jgi:hypothetical protein
MVRQKEYKAIKRAVDALDREAATRAADVDEARESNRRIADLRLMVAVLKNRSAAECGALLRSRSELGYDDLYREALNVGSFARHCLRRHATKMGRAALGELLPKLDDAVRKGKPIPQQIDRGLRELMLALRG